MRFVTATMRFPLTLKLRLVLGAALLAAGTLVTAAILWVGLGEVSRRLDQALASEARLDSYAALSGQAATFLVVATEAVQTALPPQTRRERLLPVESQLRQTFAALQADVGRAVEAARDLGLDEQSRYGAQSLGLARMEALLAVASRALASEDMDAAALRASIDIFSSGFDPLLSEAVNVELLFRNAILTGIDRLRGTLRRAALAISAVTLMAVATYYLVLIRPQFARLDRLRDAARKIGAEDFAVALPGAETDEIGALYGETNRMAAALARRRDDVRAEWARLNDTIAERTEALRAANAALSEIDANRRRFFADISHELRTPLTVILMEAQIGAEGAGDATAAFATIRARAARLTRRIDDLLRVARSDSGQLQLDPQRVLLRQLIDEIRAEVAAEIDNAGMTLATGDPGAASVTADPNWLRQVLVGLIRNAIRHARTGGRIALGVRQFDGNTELAVADNGPGIATADQARVFDRFGQGGGSSAQGFGIGLSLARWVVEAHGGRIDLVSPVPRDAALGDSPGTRIVVCLPPAPG
jgi:signal transduction histidine kinase